MKTEKILFSRPCPACQNLEGEILDTLSFKTFDGSALTGNFRLALCPVCGLAFYDGNFTASEVEKYYQENAYYASTQNSGNGSQSSFDLKHQEAIIKFLRPHITQNDAIADLGAGLGGLTLALNKQGFANTVAIDLLPEAILRMQEQGLSAYLGSALHLPLAKPCDLLIYSHIFEHLAAPQVALEEAKKHLAPGGKIFIEVPDSSKYWSFPPFQAFYLEHLNHFNLAALGQLLRRNGFTVEKYEQDWFEISSDCNVGVIRILASLGQGGPSLPDDAQKGLRNYWLSSKKHHLHELFAAISYEQKPVHIWGISQMTMLLLGSSSLKDANIISLVDSDHYKQRQRIDGLPILAPESLAGSSPEDGLLLAAWGHEKSMRKYLQEKGIDFQGPIWAISEFL